MTDRPDVFTRVHQGIRRALFDASTALGRSQGAPAAEMSALQLLDDALLLVTRHGENEDALLLPLLDLRAPEVAGRMRAAHRGIEQELQDLKALRTRGASDLYLRLSLFIAHYLEHMAEEELELEPRIRAAISDAELAVASQRAVTRVDPTERLRMLRLMLPALPLAESRTLLEKLPADVARELAAADERLDSEAGNVNQVG